MFRFLRFLTNWAITGLILLLVEFAIENIHIFSLSRTILKRNKEILRLEAENYELKKLFEEAQPEQEKKSEKKEGIPLHTKQDLIDNDPESIRSSAKPGPLSTS